MMQRLFVYTVYFLIALSFSGKMAKAQELTVVPPQIQGNWALPDCGIYDEALLFTRYFYLKAAPEGLSLNPAALERKTKDYMILSLGSKAAPVQIENDGIMTMALLEKPPARRLRDWPAAWEALPHDQTIEYTACTDAPKVVPKNMVRLMRYIDRLRDACTQVNDKNCARVVFKFADNDNNKKVSRKEITAAAHSLMLFSELAVQDHMDAVALAALKKRSDEEGEHIADDLLARYDADKSGDLDYNETVDSVTPPNLPIMHEMITKAANLIPTLKIAAMALPSPDKPLPSPDKSSPSSGKKEVPPAQKD